MDLAGQWGIRSSTNEISQSTNGIFKKNHTIHGMKEFSLRKPATWKELKGTYHLQWSDQLGRMDNSRCPKIAYYFKARTSLHNSAVGGGQYVKRINILRPRSGS
jgi:hypothetical protein